MPRTVMLERNELVNRCIDACQDCHGVCVETIIYCLNVGGRHAETSHVRLMRDCADFMLRGSEFMD